MLSDDVLNDHSNEVQDVFETPSSPRNKIRGPCPVEYGYYRNPFGRSLQGYEDNCYYRNCYKRYYFKVNQILKATNE